MTLSISNEIRRKIIHLSSVWMLFAIYFIPHNFVKLFFTVMLLAMVLFEIFVRYIPSIRYVILKYARRIFRTNEISKDNLNITSSSYFVLAVVLANSFFSKEVAIISIAVMIFADAMAAVIGKKFGKTAILDKSLEGSLAFVVTSCALIYLLSTFFNMPIPFYYNVSISVILAFVELISKKIKIDDNLSIVISACLLINIFA